MGYQDGSRPARRRTRDEVLAAAAERSGQVGHASEPHSVVTMRVRHADLVAADPGSAYKRECPYPGCTGMLLVMRDQETLEILPDDYCTMHGHHVVYSDIPGDSYGL